MITFLPLSVNFSNMDILLRFNISFQLGIVKITTNRQQLSLFIIRSEHNYSLAEKHITVYKKDKNKRRSAALFGIGYVLYLLDKFFDVFELPVNRCESYICHFIYLFQALHYLFTYYCARYLFFAY